VVASPRGLDQDPAVLHVLARRCLAGALAAAPLAGGCATVAPWERGTLSHASMDPGSQQRAACDDFHGHTFDVREGSICATGRVGGGCGCN
jgi:hypothetical protein